MKPPEFYELCDWEADLLDLKQTLHTDALDNRIGDLRDQINLLDALYGYDPDEERERERDYQDERDYVRTCGYPI